MAIRIFCHESDCTIETMAPTCTVAAMTEVFGEGPWSLDKKDFDVLRGMKAADPSNGAWKILLALVDKLGKVIVEYNEKG